jgi:copper chaperone CopZ
MMCPHCSGRVKAALEAADGVISADVSHERGDAVICVNDGASTEQLKKVITDAGYKVVE